MTDDKYKSIMRHISKMIDQVPDEILEDARQILTLTTDPDEALRSILDIGPPFTYLLCGAALGTILTSQHMRKKTHEQPN